MNTIQPNRIPCYSPLRQGGLDTASSCNLGPVVAQRQINGLRAGVQTGHALAAQCVLAASWRATGRPGPGVGGQGEARGRAGGRGVSAQVWGFTVQWAAATAQAASAAQAPRARGGRVQTGLPRQRAVGAAQYWGALARVGRARRAGLAAGFGAKQSGGREVGAVIQKCSKDKWWASARSILENEGLWYTLGLRKWITLRLSNVYYIWNCITALVTPLRNPRISAVEWKTPTLNR